MGGRRVVPKHETKDEEEEEEEEEDRRRRRREAAGGMHIIARILSISKCTWSNRRLPSPTRINLEEP